MSSVIDQIKQLHAQGARANIEVAENDPIQEQLWLDYGDKIIMTCCSKPGYLLYIISPTTLPEVRPSSVTGGPPYSVAIGNSAGLTSTSSGASYSVQVGQSVGGPPAPDDGTHGHKIFGLYQPKPPVVYDKLPACPVNDDNDAPVNNPDVTKKNNEIVDALLKSLTLEQMTILITRILTKILKDGCCPNEKSVI